MKTNRKSVVALILGVLAVFLITGCYTEMQTGEGDPVVNLSSEGGSAVTKGTRYGDSSEGLAYRQNGVSNMQVGSDFTMNFWTNVDPSTINMNTYKLVRTDTGEQLETEYEVNGASVKLKAVSRFYFTNDDTKMSGMLPDTTYSLIISLDKIKDADGNYCGTGDYVYTIETADLDYGFYFHGKDGRVEKAMPGKDNRFYDPSKPTVIYIHGWQPGTSEDNFGKENPYFVNSKYIDRQDTAQSWIDAGYNVALYYWPQWADEGEVKDAQAKLYKANNDRKNMRYKTRNGYKEFNNGMTVTDLIIEDFIEVFGSYQGNDIRIVGHSLGNQLATTLAYRISEAYYDGLVSYNAVPKRLVLLDAFWGKGTEECVDGRWVGEVCREYVKKLIQRHNIAIEQYKSSAVGGVIADENLDMRKMTAFFRIWPDFIGIIGQDHQHKYSYYWYAKSIEGVVTGSNNAKFGAAATHNNIRSLMNYGKWFQYFWYTKYGKDTADPVDDYFQRKWGVNTW